MPSVVEWALIAIGLYGLLGRKDRGIDHETQSALENDQGTDDDTNYGTELNPEEAGQTVNSSKMTLDEVRVVMLKAQLAITWGPEHFKGTYQTRFQNNFLDQIGIVFSKAQTQRNQAENGDGIDTWFLSSIASNIKTALNCFVSIRGDLRDKPSPNQPDADKFNEAVGPPFLDLRNYTFGLRGKYGE